MPKSSRKKNGLALRQKELRKNEAVRKRNLKRNRDAKKKSAMKKKKRKLVHARSPYMFRSQSPPTKVLLLGEGNFSFTRGLLARVGEQEKCEIVATSYDDKDELEAK